MSDSQGVEGRWTIHACPCGATADYTMPERLIHRGSCPWSWQQTQTTPVVPCDDAAVERVAVRAWVKEMRHTDHANSERAARRRWDSTTEPVRESWREHARDLLRAAGEPGESDAR